MAFDPKPSTWLQAGYGSDSTAHTVTMNTGTASSNKTLPELTDAKADPTTGDIRNVIFALVEQFYQRWVAIGTGGQPAKMILNRVVTRGSDGQLIYTYTQ